MKHLTTVRLDHEDYMAICLLSKKYKMPKANILRQTIHNGVIHLINGEEENALLLKRLSRKGPDVEGATFLAYLKKELMP
ncbi:MAG: hypothetical protein HY747_07730 [Elusimicrobia bacterium]|nr:hypothetical protein [Elusimicrobiota bacterium]